jgi:hypothetical protein
MSQFKFPTVEQIEKRAYELYLERGGKDGHDLEDWLAAQSELTELSERYTPPKPKVRAAVISK